jgi:hypothetical protein
VLLIADKDSSIAAIEKYRYLQRRKYTGVPVYRRKHRPSHSSLERFFSRVSATNRISREAASIFRERENISLQICSSALI